MKVLFSVLLFLTASVAWAEPPWTVDDPEPTALGKGTFYLNYAEEAFQEGAHFISLPNIAVTLGIAEETEVGFSAPFLQIKSRADKDHSGLGDLGASVKHGFWKDDGGDSLAISAQLLAPTGKKQTGLGSGSWGEALGFLGQVQKASWKWVGQVAFNQVTDHPRSLAGVYGTTANFYFAADNFVGLQAYSIDPLGGYRPGDFIAGPGAGFKISSKIAAQLQVSKGFQHNVDWNSYAGLTFDFDQ